MTTRAIASKLQNLLPTEVSWQENSGLYYVVSLVSIAAALSSTLLYPLLQGTPAALFYVAVMVSSWAGGLAPGLFTTVLSTLALNYAGSMATRSAD
jgi:K+-sensing histidine kinase KdpD